MPEDVRDTGVVAVAPGRAGAPLLASRLCPAPPPEPLVLRPRLLRALDEGTAGPVTLVRAPAGWGKTTLLASWYRAAGQAGAHRGRVGEGPVTAAAGGPRDDGPAGAAPGDFGAAAGVPAEPDRPRAAWVSVEAGDDGDRLWSYLAAALRAATDPGDDVASPPVPDRPPRPDQLEVLAAALAARERPVLLVLDDLHRIADPEALAGLEFLLRHAEQRLRLVVGARAGMPLAVHRLRLAGELTEVGPDELAFSGDEVADLLTAHGVALPAAGVRRLRERTGGWPAALRFAALALRGQPDPARWAEQFGGDQPDVAGYLREEVLAGLDPDARDLLRRSAVADAVCAGLADALTGRGDAEQTLAGLAGDGGLLRRDDSRPPWYRCPPLLADLLHAELGRLPADELRDLHLRAAGWYADNGRPAEGLRHALAGGDHDRAAALFVARWPELVPYDRETPAGRPPAPPPPEAVRRDPELGLACAAERAGAGDATAAAGHLRGAVEAARTLPAPRRDRFRRLVTALELTLARLADDPEAVRAAAARLLATRPAPSPASPDPSASPAPSPGPSGSPVPAGATPSPGSAAAPASAATGGPAGHPVASGSAADGLLAAPMPAEPRGAVAEDADVRAVAGTALGLVDLADGDLPAAGLAFARSLSAAREAGRARTELVCASRAALLHAVRGELRAAETLARDALAMPPCHGWSCREDCAHAYLALALVALHRDQPEEAEANLTLATPATGEPVVGAVAALCRAYLLRDAGDLPEGHRVLAEARERLTERPRAGELTHWLLAAESDVRGARGDLGAARDLLTRAPDATAPPLAVALARVELRAGDPRAAGYALPDWESPEATGWPLPVRLDAAVLDAVLAGRAGDDRRAGRLLERALDLAGPEGFRRAFTRAEPGVRDLLAAHLDAGTAHWPMVSELVRGADAPAERAPAERGTGALDEPLTERELTILRYLQSILSNVEIAAELSLSVNTVKTHVRNIYRKLDATRRREAVRRARSLHLI
ncbi:LuxR family maltose regulon positive regulatory protein [Micromonospora sp. M71_S20]|uniref:LuxR C-terminal-related transcriptional regulator n=1 Tax=Micromonospora sp. M71_S20 TaxID=592872 RepID=UPI000EB37B45|nr:LuxR C-terminal-related transcriptional regulator [Micromonospora sp. M71_S20]RLK12031.1 LuxR family maltose regulon positive regulatory protein [Micromonospora sp. M71_S20]